MSRVLILDAWAGWDNPSYAVLDADAQARAKAACEAARDVLAASPAVTEVTFGEWIEWFEECELPGETEAGLRARGAVVLAARPRTSSPIRVDSDRAIVSRTGIRWSAVERHTELTYETREIEIERWLSD